MTTSKLATAKRVLHTHVWRRVPQDWRRAALFQASSIVSPRPTSGARAASPILVAGPFSTATGLGQSARLTHDALRDAGYPVQGIDLSAAFMQPLDMPGFAFEDGRSTRGPGTLVLIVNGPFLPLALARIGRAVVRDKFVVGLWAWELPDMPRDWRFGIPFVHKIWTPSTFAAAAIGTIARGMAIDVIPHPVAIGVQRALQRKVRRNGDPFTSLLVFNTASSFTRKNPVAAIGAFRRAFGADPSARLVVKVSNLEAWPPARGALADAIGGAENISLIDRTISRVELDRLYADADCILSLHRSEGFGLPIAEAMLMGLPAVATDWSGTTDFFDADVGMPVGHALVPAVDPQNIYHQPSSVWAEADVDAAAAALRRLKSDPELCRRLGEAGRERGLRLWSIDAFAKSVRSSLGI